MTSVAPGGRIGPSHGGHKDPRVRDLKTQSRFVEYGASGAGEGHNLSRRRRAITRGVPGASLTNRAIDKPRVAYGAADVGPGLNMAPWHPVVGRRVTQESEQLSPLQGEY